MMPAMMSPFFLHNYRRHHEESVNRERVARNIWRFRLSLHRWCGIKSVRIEELKAIDSLDDPDLAIALLRADAISEQHAVQQLLVAMQRASESHST